MPRRTAPQTVTDISTLPVMREMYEAAYKDWQEVSLALLDKERGSAHEMVREIKRLRARVAGMVLRVRTLSEFAEASL